MQARSQNPLAKTPDLKLRPGTGSQAGTGFLQADRIARNPKGQALPRPLRVVKYGDKESPIQAQAMAPDAPGPALTGYAR